MASDAAVLDELDRASGVIGKLLGRITAEQWSAPTPCTEWSVRDLVGHLVGMNLMMTAMLERTPMPARGEDRLGDDPAGAYSRSAAALRAAAGQAGVLEHSETTRIGVATGTERLQWRIADLVVHGWDLAQAVGIPVEFPDDLVERTVEFVHAQLPNQSRGNRFAQPQPIGDDASALDRLAAFSGRAVPWTR